MSCGSDSVTCHVLTTRTHPHTCTHTLTHAPTHTINLQILITYVRTQIFKKYGHTGATTLMFLLVYYSIFNRT